MSAHRVRTRTVTLRSPTMELLQRSASPWWEVSGGDTLVKLYKLWLTITVVLGCASSPLYATDDLPYHSPFDVAFSPDGDFLALTDYTAGTLAIVNVEKATVVRTAKLDGRPTGLAWAEDGKSLFVAEYGASTVATVVAQSGQVVRRFNVGLRPMGVATAPERSLLITAVTATDEVSIVDSCSGAARRPSRTAPELLRSFTEQ